MARFALPLLAANVLQLLYTIADSAVVGRILGVTAFAAVGATASPYWLVFSMVLGMTHGFGVLFAQRFGGGDADGLRKAFVSAMYLTVLIGLAVGAFGVFFRVNVLELLGTPAVLMAGASLYIGILFGGMPVTFAFNTLSAALRALGDSKSPFIAMIISSVVNIALGIVMTLRYGIAGTAVSTLIAQVFACAYCFMALRKTELLRGCGCRWDSASGKELLRLGVPLGLRNAVTEVGGLVVQRFVNEYGPEFVAGVAAAKRMYSLLIIAGGAVEAAVGTFVAQNFGSARNFGNNDYTRVRQGIRAGFLMVSLSSLMVIPAALIFGRPLLGLLMTGDAEQLRAVLDVGMAQLTALTLGLPVLSVLLLYRSALQGMGNSIIPMFSGFLEMAARVLAVLLLTPALGERAVYLSAVLGWAAAAVLLTWGYMRQIKVKGGR